MAVPTKLFLFPQNDQFLEVDGLADGITGVFQNTATVTATLLDRFGNAVPGLTNLALAYVAASNGVYRGLVMSSAFNPPLGSGYKMIITAVVGATKMVLTILTDVVARAS